MMDRKSTKKPVKHAKKHLKLTLYAHQELKDEAYVQVLKQLKDHKDHAKCLRGWNFLAILASCYEPSDKLYYAILNFLISEIRTNSNKEIVFHANYVLTRMNKVYNMKKRKNIPSDREMSFIEVRLLLKY
jgi:hypothetical protein